MLTKDDLLAIKGIVKDEVQLEIKPLKKDVSEMKSSISILNRNLSTLSDKVDMTNKWLDLTNKQLEVTNKNIEIVNGSIKDVSDRLDTNTHELTDLILGGFATHEPMIEDHERRISRLEKATFKSN